MSLSDESKREIRSRAKGSSSAMSARIMKAPDVGLDELNQERSPVVLFP